MRISDIVEKVKGDFVMESKMGLTTDATRAMGWGYWEIVREFVQNALDASGMADIQRLEDGIVISDKGGGFNAKSFIIGVSSKNKKCDRGQFGNGMKFAIATALSLGMRVYIHSIDLLYIPEVKLVEYPGVRGTKELVEEVFVKVYRANEEINGTNVYLQGYPESEPLYRDRFILRDGNDAYTPLFSEVVDRSAECGRKVVFYNQILRPVNKELPNAIFVRDIYVADSNAIGEGLLFSYNLVDVELDVSRNIPRSFDLRWEVGRLWGHATKDVIKELLCALELTKGSRNNVFEWEADYVVFSVDDWKNALKEFYNLTETPEGILRVTACKTTDELTLVRYYARDVPILELPHSLVDSLIFNKVIYSPSKIVAKARASKAEVLPDSELTRVERRVLNFVRRVHLEFCNYLLDPANLSDPLLKAYSSVANPEGDVVASFIERVSEAKRIKLKIFKMKPGFEDTFGFYNPAKGYIAFRRYLLRDLAQLFETYTHELVHVLGNYNEPVKDTPEGADFVNFQVSLLTLLTKMIMEKHYKWLREFRESESE